MKEIMISSLVLVVILAGCSSPMPLPSDGKVIADENFLAVWDAAMEVLREYRFTVDRADKREGIITTFPLVSRHWFEFWRSDTTTARDTLEASLQTIYRRATVRIRPVAPDSPYYSASVRISVSRSDRLNPQVTCTSEAYDLFLSPEGVPRVESLTGLSGPIHTEGEVEIGRDKNLEKIIQDRINRLAAKKLTVLKG